MPGVKRCEGSTGRMKKRRYSNEFKVTAVVREQTTETGGSKPCVFAN